MSHLSAKFCENRI